MNNFIPNTQGIQVLTDSGWESFDGIVNKGSAATVKLILEKDTLVVTPSHEIFLVDGSKLSVENLSSGQLVHTATGPQKVIDITDNGTELVYDIVNAGKNKRMFVSGVLSSNCEFVIDAETLIKPTILQGLTGVEPRSTSKNVRWYQTPKKGHIYSISLDSSMGTGGDNAAIQIFEVDTTTQIGEWCNNKTDVPDQIRLLADIADYIKETTGEPDSIYYSVENNAMGEAAVQSLREYGEHNIPGTFLSDRGKKRKGINFTSKTKLATCMKFKSLLESGRMKLHSKPLIKELKTFVSAENSSSYKAAPGSKDDLVMASMIAVRMFQYISDYYVDIEAQIRDHEEIIAPMPMSISFF